MKEHKNLIANLREHAQWAEANEWETPIMLSDDLKEAANLIEQQAAEIDAAQTIDAVEVVRCKDCKHYKEFRTKRNKQIMRLCCRMGKNDMEYSVKPDDFCSYGERKDVIQK